MPKRSLWLLCWIFCHIIAGKAQQKEKQKNTDTITIKMPFSGLGKSLINFYHHTYELGSLYFVNPNKKDTVITRYLIAEKPVYLEQLNLVFNKETNSFTPFEKDFLLEPEDILWLKKDERGNFHMLSYNGRHDYIDINRLYDLNYNSLLNHEVFRISPSNIPEVKHLLDSTEMEYRKAGERISQLYQKGVIDSSCKSLLNEFNVLLKYSRISKLQFDQNTPPGEIRRCFQPSYDYIISHLNTLLKINTGYNNSIMYFIIRYEAALKRALSDNFWDYFDVVNRSLFHSDLYKDYVFHVFSGNATIKNTDELANTLNKIEAAGIHEARFDSVLIKKQRAEDLINTKGSGFMISSAGDTIQYYRLIKSLHDKYVFVDFWASWCGPCRMQVPYLRKVKKELKNENIAFISVSVDKDKDESSWISASKEEQLYDEEYNYRLLKGNDNDLLKILNIKFVPHYFLYDKNGKMIDSDFITPDKKGFKNELMDYIKNHH